MPHKLFAPILKGPQENKIGHCWVSQGHSGLHKRCVKAACPRREHKEAPGVPMVSAAGGVCVSLNKRVFIKVVSKGMKESQVLTVAGTIQAHKERFLAFLPLCADASSFAI